MNQENLPSMSESSHKKIGLTSRQTAFAMALAATVAWIVAKRLIEHWKNEDPHYIQWKTKWVTAQIIAEEGISDESIPDIEKQPNNAGKKWRLIARILKKIWF